MLLPESNIAQQTSMMIKNNLRNNYREQVFILPLIVDIKQKLSPI